MRIESVNLVFNVVGGARLRVPQGGFEEHHRGGRLHWEIVEYLRDDPARRGALPGNETTTSVWCCFD